MFLKEVLLNIRVAQAPLGKLKPEEKVAHAINMTDVCVRVCADAVRNQYPTITDEDLLNRVRERIMHRKRT